MTFDSENGVEHLYIHWPFCPYRCHFCPFVALAGHDEFMSDYHNVLLLEIKNFLNKNSNVRSIFFGGGTPSTYPTDLLLDMFGKLRSKFILSNNTEITLEVNPGTIDRKKLEFYNQMGVNRISIGVQSLNDDVLKRLNRLQKRVDVLNLLDNAKDLIDSISVDLIVGLPGISENEWKEMIEEVVDWPIKHASVYFLTIHEDTPLYFGVKKNNIILPPEDFVVDLYYWTVERFKKADLEQYEVSNFARSGARSIHNSAYWQRKAYKGFGMGACSFDGKRRFQNEKNLLRYLDGVRVNQDISIFKEELTDDQIWLEKLMLGMRQIDGFILEEVAGYLDILKRNIFLNKLDELIKGKFLYNIDGKIVVNKNHIAIVNELSVKLSNF